MDQSENFHQQLRDIIPKISEARVSVLKSEVNLKRVFWIELCSAKEPSTANHDSFEKR